MEGVMSARLLSVFTVSALSLTAIAPQPASAETFQPSGRTIDFGCAPVAVARVGNVISYACTNNVVSSVAVNPDGSAGSPVTIGTASGFVSQLAATAFNGDGVPDFVFRTPDGVHVFLSNGTSFTDTTVGSGSSPLASL